MKLLMVSPGPPSAGGKGYQVRLYNQILELADRHAITLLTFGRTEALDRTLVAACRRVVTVPWSPPRAAATSLLRAPWLPLSVGLYRQRRMAHALTSLVKTEGCDVVQLQLVRMAPYLRETAGVPAVLDLLDAAGLNMSERARAAAPLVRQVLQIEAARLRTYERKAIADADMSIVISRRDRAYLGDPPKARVLPNGIDPLRLDGDPPQRAPATVIFSGTMSYFPNADAATWFSTEILPLVRKAVPSAVFRVVGREPTPAVKSLASQPNVTVTGAVPVMGRELAQATVSVCPMRFGSGMQTKILEAMAAGTPVVGTTKALEGLPEDLRRFLHLADSPAAFTGEVVRILNDPAPAMKLAADGLDAIRNQYTWRHSVGRLEDLYEEVVAAARARPAKS